MKLETFLFEKKFQSIHLYNTLATKPDKKTRAKYKFYQILID